MTKVHAQQKFDIFVLCVFNHLFVIVSIYAFAFVGGIFLSFSWIYLSPRAIFHRVSKAESKVINPGLLWFCFTALCDWSRKLAPPSQPIRSKTKTNRSLVIHVFPRLGAFKFTLSFHWFLVILTFVLACVSGGFCLFARVGNGVERAPRPST